MTKKTQNNLEFTSKEYSNFISSLKNSTNYRHYIKSTKIKYYNIAKYNDYLKTLDLIQKNGANDFRRKCLILFCDERTDDYKVEDNSERLVFKDEMSEDDFNKLIEQLTVVRYVDNAFLTYKKKSNEKVLER